MMFRLCTVQANLDFGSEADMRARNSAWALRCSRSRPRSSPTRRSPKGAPTAFSPTARTFGRTPTWIAPACCPVRVRRRVRLRAICRIRARCADVFRLSRRAKYINAAGQSFRNLPAWPQTSSAARRICRRCRIGKIHPHHDLPGSAPQDLSGNAQGADAGLSGRLSARCRRSGPAFFEDDGHAGSGVEPGGRAGRPEDRELPAPRAVPGFLACAPDTLVAPCAEIAASGAGDLAAGPEGPRAAECERLTDETILSSPNSTMSRRTAASPLPNVCLERFFGVPNGAATSSRCSRPAAYLSPPPRNTLGPKHGSLPAFAHSRGSKPFFFFVRKI